MATEQLAHLTAFEAAQLLRQGEISSVELTRAVLERIHARDKTIHAYLAVTADAALAAAQRADERLTRARKTGDHLEQQGGDHKGAPLLGVPMSVKDVISTQGVPTTAGSRILENFVPVYDATVIEKLHAAGAHLIGKTNPDEFAMGSSTENSGYGVTRNPWDLERVPGGSSGGSAAALAADEAIFALGTDTGGSVRQPASLTNTVGLRPSYGRVSRWGVIAFASSLDQVGPMTKDVRDAALLLQIIAGQDARDATTVDAAVPNYLDALRRGEGLSSPLRGLRIGVPREYFVEGMTQEVETTTRAAIAHLENLGAEIIKVSLPHTEYALPTYYILAPAEASANLARYDSVKYGLRADVPGDVWDVMRATRGRGFGAEVKRRIMLGTYALSAGYYDAYYLKAQKVRTLIRRDFDAAFENVDVIVSPVTPTTAFRIGEKTDDPLQMYLADVFTLAQALAGIPAISIPAGFGNGLPIGLQIMARAFDEATMLRVAYAYEQTTDWHKRKPGLP